MFSSVPRTSTPRAEDGEVKMCLNVYKDVSGEQRTRLGRTYLEQEGALEVPGLELAGIT